MSEPTFERMEAGPDGWTDWVRPLPGYLMKCCDCGSVHEMDARVVRIIEKNADGTFSWQDDNTHEFIVIFSMRRPIAAPGADETKAPNE